MASSKYSRRQFVQSGSLGALALAAPRFKFPFASGEARLQPPLEQFEYGDVTLRSELHETQLHETHDVLMALNEDSLMKPFLQMIGRPAPGEDLGGWYHYDPNYDVNTVETGFAPSCTFGQWVSALARYYAITKDPATRDKVMKLNRLYAKTITGEYYENNRFPAYCYDKLVCGLIDSHKYVGDPQAYAILEQTTNTALPHLPGKAIEHGKQWRQNPAEGYTWDESYTIAENLFLAYHRGAGDRYRQMGKDYLLDSVYYNPLSEGKNVFAGRHAYSHVNSLCSAMQAYLTLGSEKHLRAASNGFEIVKAQSYATGGWGPGEQLRELDSNDLYESLTNTHSSFETPCGSYAHFKLTRYLMRVTRDSRYGDSMERVMYNTILGAKPLQLDGHTFYYSDYNFQGRKVFTKPLWPCCAGTHPQVAADYRINTYFREPNALYVNLYIPSTVRWMRDGSQISLTQKGEYPFDSAVQFEIGASKPAEFSLFLRIPEWSEGATVSVNGKRVRSSEAPGKFADVRGTWKNGDRVELNLPMKTRLEPIDKRHPETVALLNGPLVLFAITDSVPRVTAAQLLAAKKTGQQSWRVQTAAVPMTMLPFTAIGDEQYSTYVATT